MPAVSEAQRRFIYATKGAAFAAQHHFDNTGPLPERVRKPAVKKPRVRKKAAGGSAGKIRSSHLGLNEKHY